MKNTISVAIVVHNEEKYIEKCLESVLWADEIIVVDGKSEDKTASIAKKMGARVYEVDNQPLMKKTMNLAFKKCTKDWVFSLDADERVTPELAEEIKEKINEASNFTAYKIPRKNIVFGKWIANTFWYPDYQYRLFKKGKARFPEKNVHEELIVDGEVGVLAHAFEHINYETVSQFIFKLDKYTTYEAEKLIKDGKKLHWTDAIKFPFGEFLTRFFDGQGYKDGLHGLVLSLLQSFYWEVVFAKVWEHEGFWEYGDDKFLDEVVGQSKKVSHDWKYWLMASEKNNFRKNLLKLRNKIPI